MNWWGKTLWQREKPGRKRCLTHQHSVNLLHLAHQPSTTSKTKPFTAPRHRLDILYTALLHIASPLPPPPQKSPIHHEYSRKHVNTKVANDSRKHVPPTTRCYLLPGGAQEPSFGHIQENPPPTHTHSSKIVGRKNILTNQPTKWCLKKVPGFASRPSKVLLSIYTITQLYIQQAIKKSWSQSLAKIEKEIAAEAREEAVESYLWNRYHLQKPVHRPEFAAAWIFPHLKTLQAHLRSLPDCSHTHYQPLCLEHSATGMACCYPRLQTCCEFSVGENRGEEGIGYVTQIVTTEREVEVKKKMRRQRIRPWQNS